MCLWDPWQRFRWWKSCKIHPSDSALLGVRESWPSEGTMFMRLRNIFEIVILERPSQFGREELLWDLSMSENWSRRVSRFLCSPPTGELTLWQLMQMLEPRFRRISLMPLSSLVSSRFPLMHWYPTKHFASSPTPSKLSKTTWICLMLCWRRMLGRISTNSSIVIYFSVLDVLTMKQWLIHLVRELWHLVNMLV